MSTNRPMDRKAPPHFCHVVNNGGKGCEACRIPPIYDPGLSADVIAAAERIATQCIDESPHYIDGADLKGLYRIVRMLMGRPATIRIGGPVLDDESISQGIVAAVNAATEARR